MPSPRTAPKAQRGQDLPEDTAKKRPACANPIGLPAAPCSSSDLSSSALLITPTPTSQNRKQKLSLILRTCWAGQALGAEVRPQSLPPQPAGGQLIPGSLLSATGGPRMGPAQHLAWLVKHFCLRQQHQDVLPSKTEVLLSLPSTPVKS